VISALGGRGTGPTTICRDGIAAIIAAMRESGARRLLVVSASGFHTEGDSLPIRFLVKPLLGRSLRHPFADMAEMEVRVRDSDLDWTIVCPPQLTDKPYTGNVRSRVGENAPGFRIPRADLAGFLLTAVEDESLVRATVSVSG
jgi:putative NADH-flavin reductase